MNTLATEAGLVLRLDRRSVTHWLAGLDTRTPDARAHDPDCPVAGPELAGSDDGGNAVRLLRHLGSGCDLKTLAREAGVSRTGFYSRTDPKGNQRPGPYQHLAEEFQRRLTALHEAGSIPDPRELQITRLKTENSALRERIQARDEQITELTEFKERALSQLAAQHQEILRLRQTANPPDNVRNLPAARKTRTTGPCR